MFAIGVRRVHEPSLLIRTELRCALLESVYKELDGICLEVVCVTNFVKILSQFLCGSLEILRLEGRIAGCCSICVLRHSGDSVLRP